MRPMHIGDENGFTLIEVLLSMAILSIGILGLTGLAATSVKTSGHSQAITQGVNLAQERIEALLSVDYANIHLSDTVTARTDLRRTCSQTDATASAPVYTCNPSNPTEDIDGRAFTWLYKVTFIDLDANGTATETGDGLKKIEVVVNWADPLWITTRSISVVTLRVRS